ncbi:MAG: SulP family inorganic anion transporter [Pseudomonadota bacterium]
MGPSPGSPSRETWASNWPFLRAFAGYRLSQLPQDCVAGLTLAAIAIPEQMATARLAGLSPEVGFFAFLGGSLGFAIFGANRFLSCGADSTIAPIFAGGLALLASTGSPDYQMLAAALALTVGVLLIAGGLFRLGWIADLLSIPVTTGFLAGIAFHILASQLPGLFGIRVPALPMLQGLAFLFQHIATINYLSLSIGMGVLLLIAVCERLNARIPGALIGISLATAAVIVFHLEKHGIATIGSVSWHWPSPSVAFAPFDKFAALAPLSLLVAFVVMIQTAATTRAFPSEADKPPNVDCDYIGAGAGSLLAGLFGAFPVDASPPRTAIVVATGGRSQLTGLIAAALVIASLIVGARFLQAIPNAALAGVLLFVAFRIVRIGEMRRIYWQSFGEFLLMVVTFAAMVLTPIEEGVAIGIVLSLLHGTWSITRARAVVFERIPGSTIWWPPDSDYRGESLPHVLVVAIQAPLSFLNADPFGRDLRARIRQASSPVRIVVLEASAILDIDFTAAQMLTSLIRECHDQNISFAVARLESLRAQAALKRFGLDRELGPGRIYRSVEEAVEALTKEANA